MKIRTGFVSNSSSSSFCIVGWELKPSEYSYSEERINTIKEMFSFLKENKFSPFVQIYVDDREPAVFGIGNQDQEFDHYLEAGQDWQDHETKPPSQDLQNKLTSLRKEFEEKFKDILIVESFGMHDDTYWS